MDPGLSRALIANGITTLEELAYVPIEELLAVPGLDESEAQSFRRRAAAYLLEDAMRKGDDGEAVDA
jgi:N utilization substance protein A